VQTFIDDGGRVIDATLANVGYVTPITGTVALAECKKANAWYAVGIAQQVRDTGVTTATSDKGTPGKNIWTRMFEEWLARLTNPDRPVRAAGRAAQQTSSSRSSRTRCCARWRRGSPTIPATASTARS
jgi:hypothetical protein